MINKLYRLGARLLGRPLDISRLDSVCLCPAETKDAPQAIFLKDHLDRVLGVHHLSSMEFEAQRLASPVVTHAATSLYRVGEIQLFRGGIWSETRGYLSRLLQDDDQQYNVDMAAAVLTDSDIANRYFGHWLQDAVPATLVGTNEMPAIAFRKPLYLHAQGYINVFDLDINYANSGMVQDLYLLGDFSQNSHKVNRYMQLRQRMQQFLNPIDCRYQGVYIARGVTGVARTLVNEQALTDHLIRRGFDVVYPEKMTVEDLMRRLWNAPLVISVEGSGQNNANYPIALNGAYLTLQPPHVVNHVQKGICDAMNRPYGFYVCRPTNNTHEFYLDSMDDLDRVVGRLQNECKIRGL